jgi:DNA modification methylase
MNLYHGDCLKILEQMKKDGVRFDVVFTSPPYNRKRNDKYKNYDDIIDDYYAFLVEFTDKCLAICNRHVFVNVATNYYNKAEVYRYIGHYASLIQQTIIWEKQNPLPAAGNAITSTFEYFFCLGQEPLKSNTTYTKNLLSTAVNSETTTKFHRAVMKQEVADWFIEKFTQEHDHVLDPFMGLGTTGVSCKKYGRDFSGIEINEEYFNYAKARLTDTTLPYPSDNTEQASLMSSLF